MIVTDELLMAYADGELEPSLRTEMERTIAADPALVAKLERHRALRSQLNSAFDSVLSEPIPERLNAALNKHSATVTDMAFVREAQKDKVRGGKAGFLSARGWIPMAASVAVGILLGFLVLSRSDRSEIVAADGQITSRELVLALTKGLASKPEETASVRIGITYQAKSGEYCRSFSWIGDGNMAGIACHSKTAQPGEWRMHMLMSTDAVSDPEYRRAASSMPPEVIAVINRHIVGEPLDMGQEVKAVAGEWKR